MDYRDKERELKIEYTKKLYELKREEVEETLRNLNGVWNGEITNMLFGALASNLDMQYKELKKLELEIRDFYGEFIY